MTGGEFLSMPNLKDRGWTPAMVRDLLGEHDQERTNPRFKSSAPMKLWRADRVHEAEAGDGFAERVAKAKRRSAVSSTAAAKRRREVIAAMRTIEVQADFPSSLNQARKRAVQHFNARADWDAEPAALDSDREFLDRITVNYLRHAATSYERDLEEQAARFYGQAGAGELHPIVKQQVLEAIAARFPPLRPECTRQQNDMR